MINKLSLRNVMKNNDPIHNELAEISQTVGAVPKVVPYQIPPGYFEALPAKILAKLKSEQVSEIDAELESLSPLLKGISKKMPFSVPPGYFNDLSKSVEDVIAEDITLSTTLAQLKSVNPYRVPEGYFEALPDGLVKQIVGKKTAKIVEINRNRRWLNIAVAALIAGVVASGAFLFLNKPSGGPIVSLTNESIERISDNDIIQYLEQETPSVDYQTASVDMDDEAIKDMFADISDQELQQYIDQYGSSANENTLVN